MLVTLIYHHHKLIDLIKTSVLNYFQLHSSYNLISGILDFPGNDYEDYRFLCCYAMKFCNYLPNYIV
jgi:hypothetical protein